MVQVAGDHHPLEVGRWDTIRHDYRQTTLPYRAFDGAATERITHHLRPVGAHYDEVRVGFLRGSGYFAECLADPNGVSGTYAANAANGFHHFGQNIFDLVLLDVD